MPMMPGFNETTRLTPSSPVQISSTSDAKINGEALQQFGKGMFDLTNVIEDQRAQIAGNRAEVLAEEARLEALKIAKPDGTDFRDKLVQITQEKLSSLNSELDPVVSGKASSHFDRVMKTAEVHGLESGFQMGQEYYINTERQLIRNTGVKVMNNPDLAVGELVAKRNQYLEHATTGKLTPGSSEKMYNEVRATIAKSMVDGLINQKRFGEAATLLNASDIDMNLKMTPEDLGALGYTASGELKLPYATKSGEKLDPGKSEVLRGLSPDQVDSFKDMLKSAGQAEARKNLAGIARETKAYTDILGSGQSVPLIAEKKLLAKIETLPPELASDLKDGIQLAKEVSPIMRKARLGMFSDAQAQIESLRPSPNDSNDLGSMSKKSAVFEHAASQYNAMFSRAQKDPALFAIENNPGIATAYNASKTGMPDDLRRYHDSIDAFYAKSGLKPSYITKQDAMVEADRLVGAASLNDATALDFAVQKIEKSYGGKSSEVLNQIVSEGGERLPKDISFITGFSSGDSRKSMISNSFNSKKIEEGFKNTGVKEADINIEVANNIDSKLANLFSNRDVTQSLDTRNGLKSQITLEAKKLVVGGMSASSAAEMATKKVYDSNFRDVSSGRTNLIIPIKNIGSDSEIQKIENFFRLRDPRKVDIPSQSDNLNLPANENIRNLVQSNGEWVQNRDLSGAQLFVRKDGSLYPVQDKDNNVIKVQYTDIVKRIK